MSSVVHIDNENENMLVLDEWSTQGLDDTTLTAEAKYPVNFTQPNKNFSLSLHYNGGNSFFYLLILQKYINSKQRLGNKRLYTVFR